MSSFLRFSFIKRCPSSYSLLLYCSDGISAFLSLLVNSEREFDLLVFPFSSPSRRPVVFFLSPPPEGRSPFFFLQREQTAVYAMFYFLLRPAFLLSLEVPLHACFFSPPPPPFYLSFSSVMTSLPLSRPFFVYCFFFNYLLRWGFFSSCRGLCLSPGSIGTSLFTSLFLPSLSPQRDCCLGFSLLDRGH